MGFKKGRWSVILAVCLLFSLNIFTVGAAERDNASWTVGCEGFRSNGGGFVLTRDNTGVGREQLVISALDGNGKVIFAPAAESFIVGGGLYITDGVLFKWTSAPTANPLTVSVVSTEGNGYPEEVVYRVQGTCDNFATWITPLPTPEDRTVSPSVQINESSRLVTNPENIGENYVGYLIVNTFRANLRSGDGVAYTVVARVNGGTELIVLGVNEERTWWFVQVDDVRGWINNDLILVRGDLTTIPILTIDEVTEAEILPPRFYLWITSPLYAYATKTGGVVCQLEGDLEYVIIGKNGDGSWLLVEANCGNLWVEGWFPAEFGAIRNLAELPIPVVQ